MFEGTEAREEKARDEAYLGERPAQYLGHEQRDEGGGRSSRHVVGEERIVPSLFIFIRPSHPGIPE